MLGEVSRALNERNGVLQELNLQPGHLAELILLVEQGAINMKTAKEDVFPALLAGEGSPGDVVRNRGLGQVSDRAAIATLVDGVLAAFPDQVAEFRAGRANLRGFFVGQAMKAGKGQVDPKKVNEVLNERLGP